jgi:hypothetical protein
MVRMVLKSYSPVHVPETLALQQFHFLLPNQPTGTHRHQLGRRRSLNWSDSCYHVIYYVTNRLCSKYFTLTLASVHSIKGLFHGLLKSRVP